MANTSDTHRLAVLTAEAVRVLLLAEAARRTVAGELCQAVADRLDRELTRQYHQLVRRRGTIHEVVTQLRNRHREYLSDGA